MDEKSVSTGDEEMSVFMASVALCAIWLWPMITGSCLSRGHLCHFQEYLHERVRLSLFGEIV